MAYLGGNYKVPIPQMARAFKEGEIISMTNQDYDEVRFDYKTNRYTTLSQEKEIYRLQDELKKTKEKKKRELKSIIGYYYKR